MKKKINILTYVKYVQKSEKKNRNRVPIIRNRDETLSKYKPRELIDSLKDIVDELRNRGYIVEVSYSYKIKL
jgi:hypothetical protein